MFERSEPRLEVLHLQGSSSVRLRHIRRRSCGADGLTIIAFYDGAIGGIPAQAELTPRL